MPNTTPLRILLLLESARGFDRGLLKGISRYSALHGRWTFYHRPPAYLSRRGGLDLEELKRWRPDGVICPVEQAEALARLKVPMVCSDPGHYQGDLPCIVSEDDGIGEQAARHLLETGHRHFAFCGIGRLPWSSARGERFREVVEEGGYAVDRFREGGQRVSWGREQERIRIWIDRLPKPVGLFCANDDRAASILEVCLDLGLNVPDDVSLLGADNDELLCELANPPFTSIRISSAQAGYDAADLLAGLIHGKQDPRGGQRVVARAAGVVTRQSTDILMVMNPALRKALRFIRDHAAQPIQVADVVREAGLSHRALNESFQKELGSSIGKALTRARIQHISHLLMDTELQVQEVAAAVGYDDVRHFSRYFKHSTGMTPLAYRRTMLAP
jgi:LacI family transcriptional regulator